MLTFTLILILLILAGWLDPRLDWQQPDNQNKEKTS